MSTLAEHEHQQVETITKLRAELHEAEVSLRDQFAMAVVAECAAHEHHWQDVAEQAYRYADAMLTARSQEQPK